MRRLLAATLILAGCGSGTQTGGAPRTFDLPGVASVTFPSPAPDSVTIAATRSSETAAIFRATASFLTTRPRLVDEMRQPLRPLLELRDGRRAPGRRLPLWREL